MLDIFYKLYFYRFRSGRLDEFFSRGVKRAANMMLPAYFRITHFLGWYKSSSPKKGEEQYIVSLTSFPARIDKVWLTIESLLRQRLKADAVILWLYKDEFDGRKSLPKKLLQLEKRGLQIRFCPDNLMPHKKYYYTLQEFPGANIITVDDDMIYPSDLICHLVKAHEKFPKAICCAITREIKTCNGELMPYKNWDNVSINTDPSFKLLTMGGGGTLFPPHSLNAEVLNIEGLKKRAALCTDDLWLKAMSLLNKTKVISIAGEYTRFFIPIIQKNDQRLMDMNIGLGQNDMVFGELLNYYNIPVSLIEKD